MLFRIAMALLLWSVPVCIGQEFEGSYYAELSWIPDEGFFISSTVDLGIDFGNLDLGSRLKIKKNEFSNFYMDFVWYKRPIRLAGKTTFSETSFYEGFLKFRYWEDPWKVELKGSVSAEEPSVLEVMGTYGDELDAEWYMSFMDTLAEVKASLKLPLEKGELTLTAKIKEERPSFVVKWKGEMEWGELSLEFEDFSFSSGELTKEWTKGKWEFEYDLTVNAEGPATELFAEATYYRTEESGYGISFKLRQGVGLELKRLYVLLFGPKWKARIKCIAREFHLIAERAIGENLLFNMEAYVYEEEWDASLWLEGTVGEEFEWTLGTELSDAGIEELYCELYYKF